MSLFPKYIAANPANPANPAKAAKAAKANRSLASLATLVGVQSLSTICVEQLPEWQNRLCIAHGDLNQWRGECPYSMDDCLISKVLDSGGDIQMLRGLEIGSGISTGAVIDLWLESGESEAALIKHPEWLIYMAEHIKKHGAGLF
jgi:molybdopterin-binding protein